MSEETKIIHVKILDGKREHIEALLPRFAELKEKLNFDAEFLVTNDKIELASVKTLIQELIELYRKQQKDKEPMKQKVKK